MNMKKLFLSFFMVFVVFAININGSIDNNELNVEIAKNDYKKFLILRKQMEEEMAINMQNMLIEAKESNNVMLEEMLPSLYDQCDKEGRGEEFLKAFVKLKESAILIDKFAKDFLQSETYKNYIELASKK